MHPGAGRGVAARIAGTVASRLRDRVGRLESLVARDPAELRSVLAGRMTGLDALVVVGGDGAAHEAVQFCAGTPTALGLVPAGTGNDLARGLGLPLNPLRAVDVVVDALTTGRRRQVDLGRAGRHWFGTVLCAGFDAAVSNRAYHMAWPRGPRRYDLAVVAELARWRAKPLTVWADDGCVGLDATLVSVGNTPYYGGGIPVCPHASADDGMLDVTVIGRSSRWQLLRMLPSLRTGDHLDAPWVRTFRTREVRLGGNDWPVSADGERLGSLPVRVRCVPRAMTVLH